MYSADVGAPSLAPDNRNSDLEDSPKGSGQAPFRSQSQSSSTWL